jgi:2,3-dihydro-2,3-dihydroxybenzoate dehydrogenase
LPELPAPGCVVVCGAANGIGRAIALRLATAGMRLALLDHDGAGLSATTRLIANDRAVTRHVVDVSDARQVNAAIEDVEHSNGPIDGLVHAAGVLQTGSLLDADPAASQRTFEINVMGVLNVTSAVGARMKHRKSGSIVVLGSNAGGVPRANMGVYGASKAAAEMLTRVIGLELARFGIRANVVAPGSTNTRMLHDMFPNTEVMRRASVEGDPHQFRLGIPLGRIAEPDDIAAAVEFLLSPAARHITMQTLYVDGGAALLS